jgi:GNAT superfamily N-acetyltransferase
MQIVTFSQEHIEQAKAIAKANYEEERQLVSSLPTVDFLPDLNEFANNQLGVVGVENNLMQGFFCGYPPIDDAWGTTGAKGTFSPIHAHGAITENRKKIYSRLYQAAAEKWVNNGIISHAIALYAHDHDTLESFFFTGFGLRCIDAIKFLDHIPTVNNLGCDLQELPQQEWACILELQNLLINHLGSSPMFMPYPQLSESGFLKRMAADSRFFAAMLGGKCIAYLKLSAHGENFACGDKSLMNISGAYCLPEYRGNGITHNLLSFLSDVLMEEGYTRLGVDFESFNPTAREFWLKYFTPYTNSVVRRIDDKILKTI